MIKYLKNLLGIEAESVTFKNKGAIELFKDNTYLADKSQPDAVLMVGLKDNILDFKNTLNEENAVLLKELATNYNVKIVGMTMYDMPKGKQLENFNTTMIAAGISEVYYTGGANKFLSITPSAAEEKNFPTEIWDEAKIEVCDHVGKQHNLDQETVFILDKNVNAVLLFEDDRENPMPHSVQNAVTEIKKVSHQRSKR